MCLNTCTKQALRIYYRICSTKFTKISLIPMDVWLETYYCTDDHVFIDLLYSLLPLHYFYKSASTSIYWEADVVIHILIECVTNQAGVPGVGGMVFWHNKMSWL